LSFDSFAEDYDAALNEGLRATGEGKDYFARGRVLFARDSMRALPIAESSIETILDFGCGIGDTAPILREAFPGAAVLGVDDSPACIARAQETLTDEHISFTTMADWVPDASIDFAYCNGVFHHILPENRPAALDKIQRALRPGGLFAFWENNPLNPGTQYVMWKIPFDRDAKKILPHAAKRLLVNQGFEHVSTRFLFLFPSMLKMLRPIEKKLSAYPLGAQYQVLLRKPQD
jgi:trans-aconitate methyltransferase